jgi:hypothetical protein
MGYITDCRCVKHLVIIIVAGQPECRRNKSVLQWTLFSIFAQESYIVFIFSEVVILGCQLRTEMYSSG